MRALLVPFVFLIALAAPARAANVSALEIAPTMLLLKPGEAGLFYIANGSAVPVTMQIEPFDWKQANARDVLTPSQTLAVSPPFVTIAPGERQTIRVLATPQGAGEAEYRLMVSQLPSPDRSGGSNVRVLLQFSIPAFAARDAGQKPRLSWDAVQAGGQTELVARNDGAASVKLDDLDVSQNGLRLEPVGQSLGYVLPGSTHVWRIAGAGDAASLHIQARDALSGATIAADIALRR